MGPKAWGLGDAIDSSRHGVRVMPKRQWQAQGNCMAERSQDGRVRPKVAMGAMPKAARQRLYDVVIIQMCMVLDRARGDASNSGMYRAGAHRC